MGLKVEVASVQKERNSGTKTPIPRTPKEKKTQNENRKWTAQALLFLFHRIVHKRRQYDGIVKLMIAILELYLFKEMWWIS